VDKKSGTGSDPFFRGPFELYMCYLLYFKNCYITTTSVTKSGLDCASFSLSFDCFDQTFLPRDAMLSAVYAVVVCLSHYGIVSKWLNLVSHK